MNTKRKSGHRSAVSARKAALSDDSAIIKTVRASLGSLLITVAISVLLLLVGTAVAYSTADPTALVQPISYAALYIAALLGGIISAKLNRRSPYLTCALASGAFSLIGVLVAAVLPDSLSSADSVWLSLTLRLAALLIFFAGAFIGAKQKPKRSARHARKHK